MLFAFEFCIVILQYKYMRELLKRNILQKSKMSWQSIKHYTPARIAIIEHLIKVNSCVCGDIVNELPLAQPTVSQHLN
jgi:hypothetical protein